MGRIALSGTVFAPRWKRFAVLRRAKGHALPGPDTYEQISALAPNAAVRESNIFSPQMRGFWAAATGRLTRDEARRSAASPRLRAVDPPSCGGEAHGRVVIRALARFSQRAVF